MTYRITWVAIALLFAGCSTTHDPLPNKSTNWLRECTSDRMCSDGLSCLCGVCTKTCGRVDDCGTDPATTRCRAVSRAALSNQCTPESVGDAVAICVAACAGDSDCKSSSGDFECRDQVCVVRTGAGAMRADAGRDASISMSDAGHSIDGGDGANAKDDKLDENTCSFDSPCAVPCNVVCKSGQVCLGDACADVLASGLPWLTSQALDSSRLYWTTTSTDGAIQAVSLKSGEVTTLASNRFFPSALAINATHAYWSEGMGNSLDNSAAAHDGAIWRVPLSGGDAERLVSGLSTVDALAVDERYVYLLIGETIDPVTERFAVHRMPNDGSAPPELLFPVEGYGTGGDLFVDDTGLCWGQGGAVGTASKDGTNPHVLSMTGGRRINMAIDASTLYWTDGDSTDIASVPRAGGDAHVLVSEADAGIAGTAGIALDRDYVYWGYEEAQRAIWNVARVDKLLGTSQVLLQGPPLSASMMLSVDAAAVYVVVPGDPQDPRGSTGMVLRVAKP